MTDKPYIVKFREHEIPVTIEPTTDLKMILVNIDFHGEPYYRKMNEYGIGFAMPELNEFFNSLFTYHTEP